MRQEHLLDESGTFSGDVSNPEDAIKTAQISVYFKEAGSTRYVPRAALVDLEPGTSEVIKASPIGPMFKPDNFVFGASGAGNNWYVCHHPSSFFVSFRRVRVQGEGPLHGGRGSDRRSP